MSAASLHDGDRRRPEPAKRRLYSSGAGLKLLAVMGKDQKGAVIADKYELLERAGAGGMAVVWRAVMRGAAGFTRSVALKRILPQLTANDEFVQMFIEEARVGSQLQHPNIVQIVDFGRDGNDRYYLVMDWVDGLDLGHFVESFRTAGLFPPWPIVTAIGIEVLRALDAAHSRMDERHLPAPVYHRDVTPQNILVGSNGIAKLMDFGLARAMDRARMTLPHIVKGKLAYMAPEIAEGHEASARSDIFSLGVVMWEALAGRTLFSGKTDVDILLNVRDTGVPPLKEFRRDLPPGLADLIQSALAQDPQKRPRSALEMARAMAKVLRGVDEYTDAPVLGHSIRQAQRRLKRKASLAMPPPVPKH